MSKLIKELNPFLKELALYRQEEQRGHRDENDDVDHAIDWSDTPEGQDFWLKVNDDGYDWIQVPTLSDSKIRILDMYLEGELKHMEEEFEIELPNYSTVEGEILDEVIKMCEDNHYTHHIAYHLLKLKRNG